MNHRAKRNMRWFPQPQAIQAVFFDVGFTLLETSPSIPVVVQRVMEQRGTQVSLDCLQRSLPQAEAHFGRLTREAPHTWGDEQEIARVWQSYFTELLRPCLSHLEREALAEAALEVQREFDRADSYALYPDVKPALGALTAAGLKLGVISDWGIALGLILRHFDLTQYFDFAVISATARLAKPDPGLYTLALRRADVIPDYAVHVGDSYVRDVLGARVAGITGVLIDRARQIAERDVDCPLVYDLYELLDTLGVKRPPEAQPA